MAVTKVEIVPADCIACEQCVTECEEVFEMGEDTAVVKAEAQDPAYLAPLSDKILAAIESCPSNAIQHETD